MLLLLLLVMVVVMVIVAVVALSMIVWWRRLRAPAQGAMRNGTGAPLRWKGGFDLESTSTRASVG